MTLKAIPLDQIRPDPLNVRVWGASKDADAQLLASVRALGVIVPITVVPLKDLGSGWEGFQIVAGHRRFAAAQAASLKVINCDVRETVGEGEITMLQLAENSVRAEMSPVDVWRAFTRLKAEGWIPEAIGMALNLSARRVQQLVLMGQMPQVMRDHIGRTGDMPRADELRVLAQADPADLEKHWKAPKNGEAVAWWSLREKLLPRRVSVQTARFELTSEAKEKIGFVIDLFDPPEHPGYATKIGAFVKLQQAWADQRAKAHADNGWATLVRSGEDAWGVPKGCTYETEEIGRTKNMKKSERPGWVVVLTVFGDGRVEEKLHRKAKPPAAPQPTAASGPKGAAVPMPIGSHTGRPASHTADPLAAQLTEKGIFVVEAAKRKAIASAVTKDAYAYDLLAVALVALADAHGASIGEVHRLFDETGALDVNGEKRAETIAEVAEQLLQRVISDAPNGRFGKVMLNFGLAQRIGAGFAAEPTIRLDREGLDLLKKPALEAIKSARRLPGFSTQKALKEHVLKVVGDGTSVVLTKMDLPFLACKFSSIDTRSAQTSIRSAA